MRHQARAAMVTFGCYLSYIWVDYCLCWSAVLPCEVLSSIYRLSRIKNTLQSFCVDLSSMHLFHYDSYSCMHLIKIQLSGHIFRLSMLQTLCLVDPCIVLFWLSLHTKACRNHSSISGVITIYVWSVHYFQPEPFRILSGNVLRYVNVLTGLSLQQLQSSFEFLLWYMW